MRIPRTEIIRCYQQIVTYINWKIGMSSAGVTLTKIKLCSRYLYLIWFGDKYKLRAVDCSHSMEQGRVDKLYNIGVKQVLNQGKCNFEGLQF